MVFDLQRQIAALKIELKPLADLVHDPKNARTHSPSQIETLSKLIQTYGFASPICIADGNKILAGHGRAQAAKRLRLKEVPTIDLSHLAEEERRAFMLADNRISDLAGYDADILLEELSHLAEGGFDLNLTAWSQKDLEELLGENAGLDNAGDDEEPDRAPDMVIPLMLEMSRKDFERWKRFRGQRSDIDAFLDALTQLEVG